MKPTTLHHMAAHGALLMEKAEQTKTYWFNKISPGHLIEEALDNLDLEGCDIEGWE